VKPCCGCCSAVQSGTLLIDSSTIDPAASQDIEQQAAGKGAVYMDAPVSGGTVHLRTHSLTLTSVHHLDMLRCFSVTSLKFCHSGVQFFLFLLVLIKYYF